MSETSIPTVPKLHHLNNNSNNSSSSYISNKSPNKPTFSTIKNFLKNKSSLTDLKVWSDSKKDDNKDRDIPSIQEHTNKSNIHESTSTSKLSEFKLKVPRKKRSLGSLLPQIHNETPNNHNNNNSNVTNVNTNNVNTNNVNSNNINSNNFNTNKFTSNDSKIEPLNFNNSTGNIHEPKSYIIPLPTTQKFTSVASSPQFALFKHSTGTSKSSSKNVSPTKATFTLDGNATFNNEKEPQYTPDTPNMNDNYSFTKEWVAPSTIRGTYVHDWTDNSSPRSLTESMKVGKVETPSINMNTPLFQSPSRNNKPTYIYHNNNNNNHNNDFSESSISQSSVTECGNGISSDTLLSQFDSTKKKELNFNELRSKMKLDLRDLVEPSNPHPSPYNFETDEETIFNLNSHFMKGLKNKTNNIDGNQKREKLDENSKSTSISNSISNSTTDSDTDSISSHHSQGSQGSQFSFLRNRTSSVRFYKSNEQVELEKAMDEDKLDQLRIKEFIGTSQDIENDLLEVCSKNSKVVDGFDESVNYVDYEEEDDTDVLFNRDLFGLGESKPLGLGLELDLEDSPAVQNSNLETNDDGNHNNDVTNIEIGNLKLNDHKNENGDDTFTKPHSKDSDDDNDDDDDDDGFTLNKEESMESSKDIINMLNKNDPKLYLKPKTCNIEIKHRPSAKLQRHRSIKFHQLSGNIEDYNIFDKNNVNNEIRNDFQEEIWENSSALDEVNQIPEDYEYEYDGYDYEDNYNEFNNYDHKDNEIFEDEAFQSNFENSSSNGPHHLWKNLIRKTSDCSINNRNKSTKQTERIQLENCTITLFDDTDNDIIEQTNEEELTAHNDVDNTEDDVGLSTILE